MATFIVPNTSYYAFQGTADPDLFSFATALQFATTLRAGWPGTRSAVGGAGADILRLLGDAGLTAGGLPILNNAAFLGLSEMEQLRLLGTGVQHLQLGATAAAAFTAPIQILAPFAAGLRVDGAALAPTARLSVTGSPGGDVVTGGAGADTMDGGAGADTLAGNAGNDRLLGGEGTDLLNGGANDDALFGGGGADTLFGSFGNDVLQGGLDADRMVGGVGNDSYVVDAAGDVVVEATGGGIDTVSTTLNAYLLPANVETLVFIGTGNATLTGNVLGNRIVGGIGADLINGGAGADTLVGGAGNDIYVVDNVGDVVVEAPAGNIDSIRTTLASFSLATLPNVENLWFIGVGNATLTGNARGNVITGGAGADTLAGGLGADLLQGAGGNDRFLVTLANDLPLGRRDVLVGGLGIDELVLTIDPSRAGDAAVQAGLAALEAFISAIPAGAQGGTFVNDALRLSITGIEAVRLANRAPVAVDDAFTMTLPTTTAAAANWRIDLTPAALLANDSGPSPLGLDIIAVENAVGGTLLLSQSFITFRPTTGFAGEASFTYTVRNALGSTDNATVRITVPDAPPVAGDDQLSARPGQPVDVTFATLLANDADPNGLTLSILGPGGGPANGTLATTATGFTYTSDAGFVGTDSFTYRVSDGTREATGTVRIDVAQPQQIDLGPVAENQAPGVIVGSLAGLAADPSVTLSVLGLAKQLFAVQGSNLVTRGALDFEAKALHEFTVRATDASGATTDTVVRVAVEDRADTMPQTGTVASTVQGIDGSAGPNGANATTRGAPGSDGIAGGTGTLADGSIGVQVWGGNAARQFVDYTRTAIGGDGGPGGNGGNGARGVETSTTFNTTIGAAGAGGNGADGGTARDAIAILSDQMIALGATPTSAEGDFVAIRVRAEGGVGGGGGRGGLGGDNPNSTRNTQTATGTIYTVTSGQGGAGGNGGDGGNGGNAHAAIDGMVVSSSNLSLFLTVQAEAQFGGSGGGARQTDPGSQPGGNLQIGGGSGGSGGGGGSGGNGGAGGDALAEITGLNTGGQTRIQLGITIEAVAGYATGGGLAGTGGRGTFVESVNGGQVSDIRSWAANGSPGQPGAAGDAIARLAGSELVFGDGIDSVNIKMLAEPGNNDVTAGGTVAFVAAPPGATFIDPGRDATPPNNVRFPTVATIEITNNRVELGGGIDQLVFERVLFDTSGFFGPLQNVTTRLVFSGNVLDGGAGNDFVQFTGFARGIVYNGITGTVTANGAEPGAANTIRGFEDIYGSTGADRFIDGAGTTRYFGMEGADTFSFAAGHGADTVASFTRGEDRIELTGFTGMVGANQAAIDAFIAARISPTWNSGQRYIDTSAANDGSSRLSFEFLFDTITASDFVFS